MNTNGLKQLLDSCFLAKRIVETMPKLPYNMKPRHIHVLEAISIIQDSQETCRVSDVSTALDITMPSVTKLIQELDTRNLIKKYTDESDKRITLLRLTEQGQDCVKLYVTDFHAEWAESLGEIPDEKAQEVAFVMEKLWQAMPGREEKKNDRRK